MLQVNRALEGDIEFYLTLEKGLWIHDPDAVYVHCVHM